MKHIIKELVNRHSFEFTNTSGEKGRMSPYPMNVEGARALTDILLTEISDIGFIHKDEVISGVVETLTGQSDWNVTAHIENRQEH